MASKASDSFTYILASISVVILLFVLHVTGIILPIENLIVKAVSPIGSFFNRTGNSFSEKVATISNIRAITIENKELQEKNKELESELSLLKEAGFENEILRKQLDFLNKTEYETVSAEVVGTDPSDFVKSLTINRGENDGLKKGQAVVDATGNMVGKIYEIAATNAQVLLLVDANSSVVGITQGSRANGTVQGQHGLAVKMSALSQEKDIQNGEKVITAGMEQGIPKGILIGEIEETTAQSNSLFKEAKIKPYAEFKDIEIVFVVQNE